MSAPLATKKLLLLMGTLLAWSCAPTDPYHPITFDVSAFGSVVEEGTDIGIEGIEIVYDRKATTYTDENGDWILEEERFIHCNVCELTAADVDYQNNGYYSMTTIELELTRLEEGDGEYYLGVFQAADVLVEMLPAHY